MLTKHHDADYRRMLKSIPAKKKENNSYFEQNERYQGVAEFLQGDDQSYSGS